ncbi:MAG: outer membrane protein assembly factor BamE [Planctomycetota bacterium]
MRVLWSFALAASLALMGGCASVGREFDTTHVNDIKNGVTTKPQIRGWFGEPHQVTKPLQGSPVGAVERWNYTYAHSVAGASTQSEALVVDFDPKDVVVDHAYSKTNQ